MQTADKAIYAKQSVAFVGSFYPNMGGAEIQLKNLASFLARQGRVSYIFTSHTNGFSSEIEHLPAMEIIRSRYSGQHGIFFFTLSTCFNLAKYSKKYSIIQGHQLPMGIIAGVMGRLLRKKSTLKVEGLGEILRYKRSFLKMFLLRNFIDQVITFGNATTKKLISIGIPKEKIIYIPNAFDPIYGQRVSRYVCENKRVIFVGRLEYEKAPDILLKAWCTVLKKHPGARLKILGDGSKRGELEKLIAELNIINSVDMEGCVNNVRDYLVEAAVFVLPSRIEGVPLAMLEAMAAGVPVIVTPVGDIPDVIKDHENGIFVKPHDIEGLGDAISALLDSPETRRNLAEKARLTVQEFSMDRVGMRYIKAYDELLHEK
jgi:glycosyltransferase involved in cell wall biosynthesis